MSFSNPFRVEQVFNNNKYYSRKEKNSFLARHVRSIKSIITPIIKKSSNFYVKRTSSYISNYKKGSITVEAAMCIPLFFYAFIAILYLLELCAIQANIRSAMYSTMDNLMLDVGRLPYVSTSKIEGYLQESIGVEWIQNSQIVGGSEGFDCKESKVSIRSGMIDLCVKYKVKLPIPTGVFGELGMEFQETMRAKGWTGYVSGVFSPVENMVYITDEASVYHTKYNCTHLQLSIQGVNGSEVENLRNEYECCYVPCSKCIQSGEKATDYGLLYVATAGECYHSSLSCSGLKRTIHAIPLSETLGMGICSRCGN